MTPKGSDIPMLLMRMQATDKKKWEALKAQLIDFGKRSGHVSKHRRKKLRWIYGQSIPTESQGERSEL